MTEDNSNERIPEEVDFESLTESLDEIKRRFIDEERRRSAIDTKITGLLALNTLLLSATTALPNSSGDIYHLLAQVILLVSAVLSFFGLVFGHVIWGKYSRPLQHSGQIYSKIQMDKQTFEKDFLKLYIESVDRNERINNFKFRFVSFNFIVTLLAMYMTVMGNVY